MPFPQSSSSVPSAPTPDTHSEPEPSCWPLGLPTDPSGVIEELPVEAAIMCHIFMLNSVMERTGNRIAEAHSLTLPQWMALGCIVRSHEEGLTHSALGQFLMLSKAPITGVVDRLERMHLVTRTTSESDRRVSCIRSTEAGAVVWHQVRDTLRAQSLRHCACLGEEGKEQLLDLLSLLLEQVAASDPMLCATRASGTRRQSPTQKVAPKTCGQAEAKVSSRSAKKRAQRQAADDAR